MTAGAIARCRERVSVRGSAEQPESSREVLTPVQEGTTELAERGNGQGRLRRAECGPGILGNRPRGCGWETLAEGPRERLSLWGEGSQAPQAWAKLAGA